MKRTLLIALASTFLFACGGDDDDSPPDAPRLPDARATFDARQQADAQEVGCEVQASYGDLGTKTDPGEADDLTTPTQIGWVTELGTDVVLYVELLQGYGVFDTALTTGAIPLTGDELNYETCGACFRVITANQDFFITGGTLNIAALAPTLQMTLTNATWEHVTIDEATFHSTPVGDNCETAISNVVVNAPLSTP